MEQADEYRDFQVKFRRNALCMLAFSLVLLLANALVPLEEFIHRGDDAFYYFKVAANYPTYGFWTFDGIHPTNGVQPLWAWLLTATAQVLAWVNITDTNILARIFVAYAAAFHFASCILLFHLLARQVSVGTATAAAGGLLFSLGIVWTRVWGMENSLYAFLLVSTIVFYHRRFRERGMFKHAVVLGLLLGLTALSRLNAGLLIPCLLGFYLIHGSHSSLRQKIARGLVIGALASVLLVPYFAWNYVTTSHILPVSGAVKSVRAERFREDHNIKDVASGRYVQEVYTFAQGRMAWFAKSRALDGTWLAGGRIFLDGIVNFRTMAITFGALLLFPLALGRPREWLGFLAERIRRLSPFSFVPAFCLLNACISILLYPFESSYAIVRWWLVESELLITTLVATLVAASFAYTASRLLPVKLRLSLATVWLGLLILVSSYQMVSHYWGGETQYPDWKVSTNDHRYRAAIWISENLPKDAIIGSWNAGVIGYYSGRHIVNLDGLINGWDLVPYLKDRNLAGYIRDEKIEYLCDTNWELETQGGKGLQSQLKLTPVYKQPMSRYLQQNFYVYKVEHLPNADSKLNASPPKTD